MQLDLFNPDDVRRVLGDDSEGDLGYGLQPAVCDAVIDCLAEIPPRLARKLLELAAGFAATAGRRALSIEDIKAAGDLGTQRKKVIGFGRPSDF